MAGEWDSIISRGIDLGPRGSPPLPQGPYTTEKTRQACKIRRQLAFICKTDKFWAGSLQRHTEAVLLGQGWPVSSTCGGYPVTLPGKCGSAVPAEELPGLKPQVSTPVSSWGARSPRGPPLWVWPRLILTTLCCAHFTDQDTEAQKGRVAARRSPGSRCSWDSK